MDTFHAKGPGCAEHLLCLLRGHCEYIVGRSELGSGWARPSYVRRINRGRGGACF